MPISIDLLPVFRAGNLDDLLARYPTGEILACDFYITGAELGTAVRGGYPVHQVVLHEFQFVPDGGRRRRN